MINVSDCKTSLLHSLIQHGKEVANSILCWLDFVPELLADMSKVSPIVFMKFISRLV